MKHPEHIPEHVTHMCGTAGMLCYPVIFSTPDEARFWVSFTHAIRLLSGPRQPWYIEA